MISHGNGSMEEILRMSPENRFLLKLILNKNPWLIPRVLQNLWMRYFQLKRRRNNIFRNCILNDIISDDSYIGVDMEILEIKEEF